MLGQMATDPQVDLLYIGLKPWFWEPLVKGLFPLGPEGELGVAGVEEWNNKPPNVQQSSGHESHIHIRLKPEK